MSILLINDTVSENHIGCSLATKSYLNYFSKFKLNITKQIFTNNLKLFYTIDISKFTLFIINAEGTLNKKNQGKGDFLFKIIKELLDKKKKVVLMNSTY